MKYLLDTHIFLWLNEEPDKLSPTMRQVCDDPANTLVISLVSLWEIQIKQQLGKLQLDLPWRQMLETQQQDNGLLLLPIEIKHISALENLPSFHRDPFDRLLIAQALQENMTILSVDAVFTQYPAPLIS
ncbi:type II toxin-antitoxin system VapC family toxin [Methylomonas paludis]|uniref:Type II toxin-antitoxin system VapC family toxin n=1 Tax=Methylomonas paludis TaxID=1173101 RepID=A0A975R8Z6_9GAMM|nr:type II toxin-antitoxin system VapC family toxin [Methylomonas paludis]QWF69694.1 type II toxin-antitoxin system VapC family toxin [Methylomonas paludis]